MLRIYVKRPSQDFGRVFKSKTSVLQDRVAILGFINFVVPGLITEEEWNRSQQLISERFNLYISETIIDGRTKLAQSMPYFNWFEVITQKHISKK